MDSRRRVAAVVLCLMVVCAGAPAYAGMAVHDRAGWAALAR